MPKPYGKKPAQAAAAFILSLLLSACVPADTGPGTTAGHTHTPPQHESPAVTGTYEPPDIQSPTQTATEMLSYNLDGGFDNAYEYEYFEFDLGGESYTTASGRTMPYNLRGVMAVPRGDGTYPAVLITHGSHENIDAEKRFDTGLSYLVKALANNGIIAVSMDMSMPYIWEYGDADDAEKSVHIAGRHIDTLLRANRGEELYPKSIAGKLDEANIGLLGHSRGGETAYLIAADQIAKGVNINAVLAVAPAWSTLVDVPDVSSAILVPQYDGDIARLDGVALYDYLINNSDNSHSATFLMGANHNFFNKNIERDDSTFGRVENSYKKLSREEQEDFLKHFAVGYFNAAFGVEDWFYQPYLPHPNTMYGYSVSRRVRMSGTVSLTGSGSFSAGSESVKVRNVTDSFFYKEDDIEIDTVTIALLDENGDMKNLNRALTGIEWHEKGSTVKIKPLVTDLSEKTSLSINLVPDSASGLNNGDRNLRFTLTLIDRIGSRSSVTLPAAQRALTCHPGFLDVTDLGDIVLRFWAPPTPPGSVSIPLELFEGVNLSEIASIEMSFEHNSDGALFIESVTAW